MPFMVTPMPAPRMNTTCACPNGAPSRWRMLPARSGPWWSVKSAMASVSRSQPTAALLACRKTVASKSFATGGNEHGKVFPYCGVPCCGIPAVGLRGWIAARSEEHTSELQSQFHLVCRFLFEKKRRDAMRVWAQLGVPFINIDAEREYNH